MTSLAMGIHEEIVIGEGLHPDSPEYWTELDARLRKEVPHRFEAPSTEVDAQESASQPAAQRRVDTVVAPATRNNGAKAPQKIKLTETQVRLAKRLGITLEEYARELVKEQQNV